MMGRMVVSGVPVLAERRESSRGTPMMEEVGEVVVPPRRVGGLGRKV
jgi:hypothetical protein